VPRLSAQGGGCSREHDIERAGCCCGSRKPVNLFGKIAGNDLPFRYPPFDRRFTLIDGLTYGGYFAILQLVSVRNDPAYSASVTLVVAICTLSRGRCLMGMCGAILVCAATAFAQGSASEFLSENDLIIVSDNAGSNQPSASDCKGRLAEFVRHLDSILGSAPKAIDPIYEAFRRSFPIQKCNIAEAFAIARVSRFFVGSDETPAYYNIAFNSAGIGSGYGFAVQISLNKKTGNFEMPFAKVNGF
jgi:hypothetical protein